MNVEHWWNGDWGSLKKKTWRSTYLSTTNPTWTDLETNLSLCGYEKSTSGDLSVVIPLLVYGHVHSPSIDNM